MTLVLHVRGGSGNPDFTEYKPVNHIHLVPSTEPNEIQGKIQFSNTPAIQYYGIVVELRGIITLKKGPKGPLDIFPVPKNSSTVLKSSVYHQICGDLEALQKGYPGYLEPNPKEASLNVGLFDFTLRLPTDRPLPPSMTSKYVNVKYEVIVYMRTQEDGYIVCGDGYRKTLNFYGCNNRTQPLISIEPLAEAGISQPFSGQGLEGYLKLPKTHYYRNEEINFNVQIIREEKSIPIKLVSVFLLRTVIASYNFEEVELEKYVSRNSMVSPNQEEFSVRGVFKRMRELPSYNDDGATSSDGGLRIVYTIKCEVSTDEETIGGQVEVLIQTVTPTKADSTEDEDNVFKSKS